MTTMAQQQQEQVRDMEELEGALLLPEAHLVMDPDQNAGDAVEATVKMPAIPHDNSNSLVSNYSRNAAIQSAPCAVVLPLDQNGQQQQPPPPTMATALNFDNSTTHPPYLYHNSALLRVGEERGRIDVDQEATLVEKNQRNVNAIHYHQQADVQEANAHAKQVQQQEESGKVQTTTAMATRHKVTSSAPSSEKPPQETTEPQTEAATGTFGQEYEVAEYQIGGGYDTQDYEVKEYKSVYDA